MRTTSTNIARQLSIYGSTAERGMQHKRLDLAKMQERLTTGLRVNRPSDDPVAYEEARRLDDLGRRLAQYDRSVAAAQTWSDHTQDVLDDLAERFMQVYERGIRITNQTFSDTDRETEANNVEAMLDEMVTLLNEKNGEDYLFAGTRTTTQPFALAGSVVTYNGNTGSRAFQIGEDLRVNVNITGDQLMNTGEGFTIFESMQALADAVRSGDSAQMQAAMGQITTARDHVIEVNAEAGSIGNRLGTAEAQLQQASLRVAGRLSEVQDADIAETLLEYQEAQTSLQAALKVTASVLQTSLLDYLR